MLEGDGGVGKSHLVGQFIAHTLPRRTTIYSTYGEISMYNDVYMYICMYVCMYVCVYVCVCVCMYVCIMM